MNCKCIEEIDNKLSEQNLKLTLREWALMLNFKEGRSRLALKFATRWLDESKAPKGQKKSPPGMLASFCPFCGKPI